MVILVLILAPIVSMVWANIEAGQYEKTRMEIIILQEKIENCERDQ